MNVALDVLLGGSTSLEFDSTTASSSAEVSHVLLHSAAMRVFSGSRRPAAANGCEPQSTGLPLTVLLFIWTHLGLVRGWCLLPPLGSPLILVTVPASVLTNAPSGPTPTMDFSNGCQALLPARDEGYNSLMMAMSAGPSVSSPLSRLDADLPVFVTAYNSGCRHHTEVHVLNKGLLRWILHCCWTARGFQVPCLALLWVRFLEVSFDRGDSHIVTIVAARHASIGASEVVSSLVAKIMSTRGPKIRGLAINTIRAIVIEFLVTPTPLPRFNMTRAEYYTLAPCWGRSTPCLNRVGSSSSHPETHDYDRFRRCTCIRTVGLPGTSSLWIGCRFRMY